MKAEFHFEGEPVAFAVVEKPVVLKLMEGRARVAKGWCQSAFKLPIPDNLGGEKVCAYEAIKCDMEVAAYLYDAMPKRESIILYNDGKGRTQADILALYDRAIALARAA